MAGTKISDLTAASTLAGTEVLPVVQSGATKKATVADVAAYGRHTGSTTVNFGAFPGDVLASVAITGQTGITTGSIVRAWLSPTSATSEHSTDEHAVDGPHVFACDVVAGTGFTIKAVGRTGPLNGTWRVSWEWS